MIKSKTKMSTLLVALLTILTVLLGALFVAKPVNAPALSADGELTVVEIGDETLEVDYFTYEGWYIAVYDYSFYWLFEYSLGDFFELDRTDGEYVENPYYDPEDEDSSEEPEVWQTYRYYVADGSTGCFDLRVEITGGSWCWDGVENLHIIVPSTIEVTGGFTEECYCDVDFYTVNTGVYTIRSFTLNSNDEDGADAVCLTIPTSIKELRGDFENIEDIYYQGTSDDWDSEVTFELENWTDWSGLTVHCTDNNCKTILYNEDTGESSWSSWSSEGSSGSGDTPSTGIELNIGVAVLSLALVSTLFVVARRKEER